MAQEYQQTGADYDPEAEVVFNTQTVNLPQIPVVTGEEDDQVIAKFRAKLYRWRGQWKQRGVGDLKLLKNKNSGKIRLLMRADKTHKIVANHLLQRKQPLCNLEALKTSNNSWTWISYDISDNSPVTQKFCGKFTSKQEFQKFKTEFDKACQENNKAISVKQEVKQAEKTEVAKEAQTKSEEVQKKQ